MSAILTFAAVATRGNAIQSPSAASSGCGRGWRRVSGTVFCGPITQGDCVQTEMESKMHEISSVEIDFVSGGEGLPGSCSAGTMVGAATAGAISGAIGGAVVASPTGPGALVGAAAGAVFFGAVGAAGAAIACAVDISLQDVETSTE